MSYGEDEYLRLSGLQHFAFCRRQWALIHIEQQWAENYRTTDGNLMHERAHDSSLRESRGDVRTAGGVYIRSAELGVSGQCDVLEFHRDAKGVPITGWDGLWRPYPVEYKRGRPKEGEEDVLQLCGQAMCLESMLCCDIPEGSLFYGETRRRQIVAFTPELRGRVKELLCEMHALYKRGTTPRCKPTRACGACSLKELCMPGLLKKKSALAYLRTAAEEAAE